MPKTVIEKRSLRYDFTASEIHDKSLQLAKKNKEVEQLENEKKSVTSQLQGRINSAKAEVGVLASQVSDGWEYRDIECDVIYHMPGQGKKTVIRKDINRKTAVETMAEHEWDLFNQPDDSDIEREDDTVDADFEEQESGTYGPRLLDGPAATDEED
jgi:hypothetical protein